MNKEQQKDEVILIVKRRLTQTQSSILPTTTPFI